MVNEIAVNGSLHSHGCWTDYRNPGEQARSPFNLEAFVEHCISCGRDFQAITDIMANWPDSPEFIEHRYEALLKTANPKSGYNLQSGKRESIIYTPAKPFVIPRSQEILTSTHFKHVLAVGAEKDIRGGRSAFDILKEIQDNNGYAVIDHPFMCDAWLEEEILELYHKGLIAAIEWNGGLTLPAFASWLLTKVPSKKSNKKSEKLETDISLIANDDSHCADDIYRGAFTTYQLETSDKSFVDRTFDAINNRRFQRHCRYSAFFSPFNHIYYGSQSRKLFSEDGLPPA